MSRPTSTTSMRFCLCQYLIAHDGEFTTNTIRFALGLPIPASSSRDQLAVEISNLCAESKIERLGYEKCHRVYRVVPGFSFDQMFQRVEKYVRQKKPIPVYPSGILGIYVHRLGE